MRIYAILPSLHSLWVSLLTVFFIVCGFFSFGNTNNKAASTISLQVVNSFSGTTQFASTGTYYLAPNGTYYTSGITIPLLLSATTSSIAEVYGTDIVSTYTGAGTGMYTLSGIVQLSGSDGIKEMPSQYTSGREVYIAPPLEIFLDTTPPSSPSLLSPSLGSIQSNNNIIFSWGASTDTGAGLNQYTLIVSNTPSFTSSTSFITTLDSLTINESLVPEGVLYRYVIAEDNVGNTSQSSTSFFTKEEEEEDNKGSSGHGSRGSSSDDYKIANTTFSTFSQDDANMCIGNIRGYIYGKKRHEVDIRILLDGDITYSIKPLLETNGYYHIPVEYTDTSSERYIAPGTYKVRVTGDHPTLGEKRYVYDTFSIGACNDDYEIPTEHFAPTYDKQLFDILKILKIQNTEQRLEQKKNDKRQEIQTKLPTVKPFEYPEYLQETGADPVFILQQLHILALYAENTEHKETLLYMIHSLQPGRYAGIWLLLLLCYDIDFYRKWQLAFMSTKGIKKTKKTCIIDIRSL